MFTPSPRPRLILASTSRYRRELLQRLRLPFDVLAPDVDESALPGEAPKAVAQRLALAKCRVISDQNPDAVVIGSDQVCELNGQALSKPGDHARATEQLQQLRGRTVVFHSAVAVRCLAQDHESQDIASVRVQYRALSDAEIETYLRLDMPYDCAGSSRCEALGISLLDAIENDDPTALVGLSLIRTARMLRAVGIDPLHA